MNENLSISGNLRNNVGKGASRSLRRVGKIPAIIYGDKKDSISVDIEEKEYKRLMNQPGIYSRLIDLSINGETNVVLTRDIQIHPLTENPLHVDFLRIGKGSVINVSVPVVNLNEEESPGLKSGGVLNIVRHQLELDCPAENIPDKIEIDLTGLVVGDSIHISSVNLPEGVKPSITDRDFTIATIAAPTKMVETSTLSEEETQESEEQETSEENKEKSESDDKDEK